MANVRVRPESGKLYFDFHVRGQRCREYSTLDDSPANRRKMEKVLAKIESEIAQGTFEYARYFPGSKMAVRFAQPKAPLAAEPLLMPNSNIAANEARHLPLFKDFVIGWKENKQVEWRLSYRDAVDSILATHLLPAFGECQLDTIDRTRVLGFRSELAKRRLGADPSKGVEGKAMAPATINRIIGIVRMILDEAALQFGLQNPCISIKRLKLQRQDVEPFTVNETQAILARVRPDYRPYLTFRFFTGVRSGEAHGLKWKHVDFERRQILVRETFLNGRTEYTKTDGSQREIHMSQAVYDALMSMKPSDDKVEAPIAECYVFCTRNGLPVDNTNFNDRVWKPLLRNLGLKYRRPYQMRHTCATLWLAAGESPEWIARQLGHTTTEMLFRTYSRYVPNLVRKDGGAFDTLIAGVVNGGIKAANDEAKGQPQPFLQIGIAGKDKPHG
ncbi:Arm DNA-binding domain-containing protein [Hydrocarboniphaga effusa]|uniref:Arm DNA-binding domain-containing protein n=1 Tax=Hydrocarboniphaga effusa TaxID=243629 RepID=UPI003BA9F084